MESRRILSAILKLWVLAIIAVALYFLWQQRSAPPLASTVEAAEQVKHTSVEVRIGSIHKMTLHDELVTFGYVEPEPATADKPAAEANITVDWPAVVSEVDCTEGQAVKKGQTLFIYKNNSVSSPIEGTVIALNIRPGEVALPTTTAIKIVDLNRLVVAADIPSWQISQISLGHPARIELPATQKTFDGNVQLVDRAADPATNLVSVDIAIPPNSDLRPGQFAKVSIVTKETPDALVVPADAIVRDSQGISYVALVSDDHKQATLKRVEPGLRQDDWVQISADGLSPDQIIVTGGAFGLLFKSDISVLNP
jgi:multidrug efflux pump subunit AcrA (membrane-fusion protein)